MGIPDEWRPRPMIRVWGLPAAATEEQVADALNAKGLGHAVRSVTLDPRQATPAGQVALVRFEPPPLPDSRAALPGEAAPLGEDVGKVAEGIIAALRADPPEVLGVAAKVEKTGAEVGRDWRHGWQALLVAAGSACALHCRPLALLHRQHPRPAAPPPPQVCLFLSHLRGEAESDQGLRAAAAAHGALERCFVMRNPAGASKGYAIVEFAKASDAAGFREAWNRAGAEQKTPYGGGHPAAAAGAVPLACLCTCAWLPLEHGRPLTRCPPCPAYPSVQPLARRSSAPRRWRCAPWARSSPPPCLWRT